jgi:hypothetical protein
MTLADHVDKLAQCVSARQFADMHVGHLCSLVKDVPISSHLLLYPFAH